MATKYPPYVNAHGCLSNILDGIKKASVPPKFTQDYVSNILGLKSSSYRAMIPFLKNLGFLDQGNVPTQAYKDFRDETKSGAVMAQRIREAYSILFSASEYAYKLKREEIIAKLRTILGVGKDDKVLPFVAGSFLELCKIAEFDGVIQKVEEKHDKGEHSHDESVGNERQGKGIFPRVGISYTINLNLPATTEIEVFNAIFKSLREHILNEK